MKLAQRKIESLIGPLFLVASENGLQKVFWEEQHITNAECSIIALILDRAEKEISEYFAGNRKVFEVPLDFQGSTFQKKVWKELLKVPYGETTTYKEIAIKLQSESASRAVGAANGHNPLCIIVPCHRVISSDGSLRGYSGGLERKKKLLELEVLNLRFTLPHKVQSAPHEEALSLQ